MSSNTFWGLAGVGPILKDFSKNGTGFEEAHRKGTCERNQIFQIGKQETRIPRNANGKYFPDTVRRNTKGQQYQETVMEISFLAPFDKTRKQSNTSKRTWKLISMFRSWK